MALLTPRARFVLNSFGKVAGFLGLKGETIPLTTVGFPPRVPQFIGGFKPFNNFQITDGGAFLRTSYLKVEAEAPFSAVRIWYQTRISTAVGPFIGVVAPTETMSKLNTTLAYIPQVGGASQNTLQVANYLNPVSQYGHRQVTWDAGATSFTLGGTVALNTPGFKCSDIIPCRSVPRVDVTGVAASRHACMLRVFNSAGNRSIADATAYYAELGQPWFREFQMQVHLTNGTDGVTTLTNIPVSVPGTITNNAGYSFWIEFFYDSPTRHILNIGDSRQDTWPRRLLQYSTPSAPIAFTELTMPGNSPQDYLAAYDNIVTAGLGEYTDVVMQGTSINQSFSSRKIAEDMIWAKIQMLKKFRANGARVFLTTDYGYGAFTGELETGRQRNLQWVRSVCASGLAILVDTDPLITDYTNPLAPIIKADSDSGDNTHANVTPGEDRMFGALNTAWLANT